MKAFFCYLSCGCSLRWTQQAKACRWWLASPVIVVLSFVFFAEVLPAQDQHTRACHEELREFSFEDRFAGCDEAVDGRWFLHFEAGGDVRIGLWSSEPERILEYRYDEEEAPDVFLDDVFSANPRWRREGPFTLEISNDKGKHLFTLVPNYGAMDPKFSVNYIQFFEVGGRDRVFVLSFYSEAEQKFRASKEFR